MSEENHDAGDEDRNPIPALLATDELPTLDVMQRRYVKYVLEAVNGNKSKAAKVLGIDRRSVYRRLEVG